MHPEGLAERSKASSSSNSEREIILGVAPPCPPQAPGPGEPKLLPKKFDCSNNKLQQSGRFV